MAIVKRGKSFHVYFRPFDGKLVTVKTQARSKTEAKQIEMVLLSACRSGDYRSLSAEDREVCLRMFRNQGWAAPSDLLGTSQVKEELTLWKAAEVFLTYPEVRTSASRERFQQCIVHLVEKFGKDYPIKSMWVPEIKQYQMERLNEGAAAGTINREKSTLSKMFQVLIELRYLDVNPARLVKNLSEKNGERQVYLGKEDLILILQALPEWLLPIVETAYYTGMRQGEILNLTRGQLQLSRRLIVLAPEDVKEARWKRVPLHEEVVSILEKATKVCSIKTDRVFLIDGRPLSRHSIKKPWHRAIAKAEVLRGEEFEAMPRFHDLRHTWKTNARRSGMDPEIRESIMGHWSRERSVSERYGRISDEELTAAIDSMTFDHGPTEILVANAKREKPGRSGNFDQAEKMLAEC